MNQQSVPVIVPSYSISGLVAPVVEGQIAKIKVTRDTRQGTGKVFLKVSGSASYSQDYTLVSNSAVKRQVNGSIEVSFGAGVSTREISFQTHKDIRLNEPLEDVLFTVQTGSNYRVGRGQASFFILNNEIQTPGEELGRISGLGSNISDLSTPGSLYLDNPVIAAIGSSDVFAGL